MGSSFKLGLCVGVAFLFSFTASTSFATYYSWVDDQGVLHLTNLSRKEVERSDLDAKDRFGGKAPIVLKLSGGKKRKLFPVNVSRYDGLIRRAAKHYKLPFAFVKSVIKVESNFNPTAVSRAGAKGLMQLMDFTAKDMSVEDSFDPEQNVFGGTRYLRLMANQFDGDIELTAAAYNAGPTAVRKAKGVPNFRETKKYVVRVKQMYEYYKKMESGK